MKERLRYARRFVVLATVAFATSWVVLAHPAYADPGGTAVPDGGAQPVPSGALTPPSIPPVAQGPLAQQVTSEEAAVEQIGEQLKQVKLDLDQVKTVKASARDAWSKADDEVTALKAKAEQEAADAYKAAVALGPLDQYASDLHKLSVIAPGLRGQPGTDAAAHELVHAEEVERAAYQAYQSADENEQSLTSKNATLTAAFTSRSAGLADLRRPVSPVRFPRTTSRSPPNSHRSCRQAPQGGVGLCVSATPATRAGSSPTPTHVRRCCLPGNSVASPTSGVRRGRTPSTAPA